MLNSELVAGNRFLQDYFTSHPLAAKLSHDDVGPLSQASDSLAATMQPSLKVFNDWLASNSIQQNVTAGLERGFGDMPISGWIDPEEAHQHPFLAAAVGAATMVPELALREVSAGIFGAAYGVLGQEHGERLAQVMMDPGLQASIAGAGPHGAIAAGLIGAMRTVMPWIREGKAPPIGVHPVVDSIYKTIAEDDIAKLDDAVKDSAATATHERAPEFYGDNFVAQHTGEASVRIDANAIARLYGDSRPEVDDGMLGWIPNLAERLDATAGSGGYIDVPMKDFIANIAGDPELYKSLREDILLRDTGFTLNEAKEVEDFKAPAGPEPTAEPGEAPAQGGPAFEPEAPEQGSRVIDTPVQALRGAAGWSRCSRSATGS